MQTNNIPKRTAQPKDFAFEVGQHFRHGVIVFKIVEDRKIFVVVEHAATLDRKIIQLSEIVHLQLAGEIIPCTEEEAHRAASGDSFVEDDEAVVVANSIPLLSDAAKQAGLTFKKYIQALRAIGYACLRPTPLLELELKRLQLAFKDIKAPKLSTLYSYSLALERQNGDWHAVFPNFAGRGGRGKSRINLDAATALQKIFEELRARPDARIRAYNIEKDLQTRLQDQHGPAKALDLLPSRSALARHTKREFGAYFICVRNRGQEAANKIFRGWHPRDRMSAPLAVAEFDDKDTRVFSIDERTNLPAGRIYLTGGIDQYSSGPMGFSISDKPRNTWSAISAFVNSVLPKDLTHPMWSDVESEVPYFGKMAIAVFDNALYNHAADLNAATLEVSNAAAEFAKAYTPTEKSVQEDFWGRMVVDFLPTLPGFAGEKDVRDQLTAGLLAANLCVGEFMRLFLKWTYDIFCNTPRDGGMTPRQRWEFGMRGRKQRIPADIHRVLMAAMPQRTKKLRPEQILFAGLIFQNARLEVLQGRIGHNAPVTFRYHPEHIDRIYVQDPILREWFLVKNANPEYTENLTLSQHELIMKMAREAGKKNPSIPELLVQRNRLSTLVDQARWSTKLKERRWAKSVSSSHSSSETALSTPQTMVMTDLESQVRDIQDVEMESGDEGWEIPVS